MKHFVLVSAAIVFLAGCSANYPAHTKPTTPPQWTEEEIASYDHFMASLVLVGDIKKELPKLKRDQPAGARRFEAMCRDLLKEAELVDPECLAKAHADLPRVFETWYLPWLKDQFGRIYPRPGSPDYGRYALKQWNAWCKANWKNVRSPHEITQPPGSSEATASRDKKETAPPRWTEDEDAAASNNRGGAGSAKKESDKAIRNSDEASRSDAKYAFAYYNRGNASWAKKNFDSAIQDYDAAIRIDPRYALAFRGRGFAWFHEQEYEKAIKDFDEVIRLDPKEAYAVIFGHFAARRAVDGAAATRFLNDSARNLNDAWPYPVVRFLRGEIGEPQLLKLADNRDKRTEARCYLGLDHAIKGRKSEALVHFRWVKEHGDTTFAEYTIAEAELERLERAY
jgi:tetratricopeptide (TPR) repeat protein